ncbi:MAG: hypothetical protein RDV41_04450 [Planctomycetota bacterium]|nr:hypothetical protein [Planctomycetota bacterium]
MEKTSTVVPVTPRAHFAPALRVILLALAGTCVACGSVMLVFRESLRGYLSQERVDYTGYTYVPKFRRVPLFLSQAAGHVVIRGKFDTTARLVDYGMAIEDGLVLTTGDDGSVVVSFEDLLAVEVGVATEVVVERAETPDDMPAARQIRLACAQGTLAVATFFDSIDASITITTPTHTIVGNRARFELRVMEDSVSVSVFEGQILCWLNDKPEAILSLAAGHGFTHRTVATADGGKAVAGTPESLAPRKLAPEQMAVLQQSLGKTGAIVRRAEKDADAAYVEKSTRQVKEIVQICKVRLEDFDIESCLEHARWPLVFNDASILAEDMRAAFTAFTRPLQKLTITIEPVRVAVTVIAKDRQARIIFPGMVEVTYAETGLRRSREFLASAVMVQVEDRWLTEKLDILETWCPHQPFKEK